VAIADLVLLHNKASDAQAKKNLIGVDVFDKIPDVKREFLKFCKPFEARLRRNVKTHRVIPQVEEAGPFENQPSISRAPQGELSGTPSRLGQDQLFASNGCRTDQLQDTIGARDKLVDGLQY